VFAYAFMRQALAAGVLTGLLCSVLSFFIYLRRLPYAASGIAHAAFGGVAVGIFLGVQPAAVAAVLATLLAVLIGYISRRSAVAHESTTGIVAAGAMAAGVVLLGFRRGYVPDLFSYLFGSILAVSRGDLVLLAAVSLVVLGVIGALFGSLLYVAFDSDSAGAAGLPVALLDYVLLVLVALTVVVAVRMLGIVLASALLITPAATGHQLARGYRGMLAIAVASGVGATVAGLVMSYRLDLASGATITLCSVGVFGLACLARALSDRARTLGKPAEIAEPSSDPAPQQVSP